MAQVNRIPIYGQYPPCAHHSRLTERKAKARARRLEKARKQNDKVGDFVKHEDSEDEDNSFGKFYLSRSLNSSFNFVDYLRSRESQLKEYRTIRSGYSTRFMLKHEMFHERPITLTNINKVMSSQWISSQQVIFGTMCHKIMVYDVNTHKFGQIPLIGEPAADVPLEESLSGIHTIQLNPSRSLLATQAQDSNNIAVYSLPTMDPVCVGSAHDDWIYDLLWLDDMFLISGSRDSCLALWRIEDNNKVKSVSVPSFLNISPKEIKGCKGAVVISSLVYNQPQNEVAALSLNGYIHIWNPDSFRQKMSKKIPSTMDCQSMAVDRSGTMYAVGCRSATLLLDSRTLQPIKKILARYTGCGIFSTSFKGNVLTIGTGVGTLMFYDLRAGKYLESCIHNNRTIVLKTTRGHMVPSEDNDIEYHSYSPAIYTHCYDHSGTRLFAAGGPVSSDLDGHYAAIWQ